MSCKKYIQAGETQKQVDEDNDLDTDQGDYGDLFSELERSGDLQLDKVTKADVERAEDFWKNSETNSTRNCYIKNFRSKRNTKGRCNSST